MGFKELKSVTVIVYDERSLYHRLENSEETFVDLTDGTRRCTADEKRQVAKAVLCMLLN